MTRFNTSKVRMVIKCPTCGVQFVKDVENPIQEFVQCPSCQDIFDVAESGRKR